MSDYCRSNLSVMRILFCYLIFGVVMLQLARCQGFGGGGPSNFGYDASSACSKPYSRTAKARFENLPCDFRLQNWCTVAGSAYPWHAVRRFVQENQGLMRRMYGEETHFSVLRAELEKNDVELEIDGEFRDNTADDSRSFHSDNDFEYHPEEEFEKNPLVDEEFTNRGFEDQISPRKSSKFPNLEFTKPHFRPSPISTASTSPKPEENSITNLPSNESTTTNQTPAEPLVKTSLSPVQIQNLSINEIPGQLDRIDVDVDESNTDRIGVEVELTTELGTVETGVTTDNPTTLILDRVDDDLTIRNSPKEELIADQASESSVVYEEQFRPRPEYKPADVKPESPGMEGQLFQDVAAKDQQPVLKLRGVNACPVKEEVVAPFWANNTRGEVLALLNLYPFEQYVHWEKCTHENKQMYCRDGCRCEQQYRLHRLLAYDPNNECRGIFSDWFKFPSCCVCRCYDLPVEFRVTSRSPRAQRPRSSAQNRKPSEWYRHQV